MPRQQRFGCDVCRDLCQKFPAEFLRFRCKTATLVIGESDAAVADLFSKNAILLNEEFDHLLLTLIHPAQGFEGGTDATDTESKAISIGNYSIHQFRFPSGQQCHRS
jgi:hypothetical protein